MDEWIPLETRKPPNDIYVLVAVRLKPPKNMDFVYFSKMIAARYNDEWVDDHNGEKLCPREYRVTHWIPLPDDPQV